MLRYLFMKTEANQVVTFLLYICSYQEVVAIVWTYLKLVINKHRKFPEIFLYLIIHFSNFHVVLISKEPSKPSILCCAFPISYLTF